GAMAMKFFTTACALMWTVLAPAIVLAQPGNPVVDENKKAGTTDWLLFNYDKVVPGRDDVWKREKGIEGYCSHTSIRAGETLKVFVSSEPAKPFKIDFYRMGYYGGKGGRHLLTTGTLQGETQPTPADGAKRLIECKWKASYELKIPADWLSGVYLGKLQVAEPKAEAYVVFIVRDDRRADFLFQCSDLTWQAYNRWPAWRSLYDFQDNRWHTDVGNEVGFDRPYSLYYNGLPARFNPLTHGSGEFLVWEHPLCFWRERGGYDVSYPSNLDTHNDAAGLRRAKGFLSVGHDEYWTRTMMENVAAARDAGVHLAFLGGNSVSGRITLKPASDGRPDRVFGRWEQEPGCWFDNERDLMGATSYGVGAADRICRTPEHWAFAGRGL